MSWVRRSVDSQTQVRGGGGREIVNEFVMAFFLLTCPRFVKEINLESLN